MFWVSLPLNQSSRLLINCFDRSIFLENASLAKSKAINSAKFKTKLYSISDFRDWFRNIVTDMSEIKAVLFLTKRCNLNCPYCFQDGYTKEMLPNLPKEKAKSIIKWIKDFAILNNSNTIHLYLYGGEPTLRPELIEYLKNCSKEILEAIDLRVIVHMYTNAAKIDERVFSFIKTNFIKYMQITLDGMLPEHDMRRPYKNGNGTFKDIMVNIKRVLSETDAAITILSNFDYGNIDSIKKLYCYLEEEKLTKKLFFTVNPLFRTEHNCNYCGFYDQIDDSIFSAWSDLLIEMNRRNLNCNPLPLFDKGPCSFWRSSHFVFDTYGEIYKCIGLPGNSKYSIGNVDTHSVQEICMLSPYFSTDLVWDNEECLNCPYLPLCLGGCRFQALINYKSLNKVYCHKNLIEKCELNTLKKLYCLNG